MSKRPAFYVIEGGLTQEQRIYRLRERPAPPPAAEIWPRDGEWRRLIRSLMRNPPKSE